MQSRRTFRGNGSAAFLEVDFGVERDAHPQIYDFFLSECGEVLQSVGEKKAKLVLERLEPLDLSVYSNLEVAPNVLRSIFRRYCKSHRLKPAPSAYDPRKKTSCQGTVAAAKLPRVLSDYNLLFDLFFCDIRIQTKRFLIDCMDPFSNLLIVQAKPVGLTRFQRALKRRIKRVKFKSL